MDMSITDGSEFGIDEGIGIEGGDINSASSIGLESSVQLSPYDDSINNNLVYQCQNALGRYMVETTQEYNRPLLESENIVPQIKLSEDFSPNDIQNACNKICDALNWRHLPISIDYQTPNAAFSSGIFVRSSFDDHLFLNPNYAHECINKVGSTDIVLSDIAHEVGHSIAFKQCGNIGTFMNEKLADFVSGFANAKLGIDIDTARQWFEWHYDNAGRDGYPISEERWDAEAAGYYFAQIATSEELMAALQDNSFLEIIKNYHHDFHLHGSSVKSPMEISSHPTNIDDITSVISIEHETTSPMESSLASKTDTIANHSASPSFGARFNDKEYYEKLAKDYDQKAESYANEAKNDAQKAESYANEAKRDAEKGDFQKAKEHSKAAEEWTRKAKEHAQKAEEYAHQARENRKNASECTK